MSKSRLDDRNAIHLGESSAMRSLPTPLTAVASIIALSAALAQPPGSAPAAPVTIDQHGITVSGKNKQGSGLGIIFVHPNPLNPSRYIVVITGHDADAVLAAARLFEQDQYGDDYTVTHNGPSGHFDGQWQ